MFGRYVKFPWLSLNNNPIAVEIDDVYVLLTPLDPANAEVKTEDLEMVEEVVKEQVEKEVKAALQSEKEQEPESKPEVDKKKKEEKKKTAKKEVDPNAITDFSGAFDLATALVNNFTFALRRLHIRIEGNPNSPIPMFSLGVALESIELNTMEPTETISSTDIRKSFDMNGLTIYWCLNNTALLAQAEESTCLTAMRSFFKDLSVEEGEKDEQSLPKESIVTYNPDDRLLDNMNLRVVIQGDLRKIEDRQRSVEESLEITCNSLALDKEANPTHALVLEHLRQLDLAGELAKPVSEFAKDLLSSLPEEDARHKDTVALSRKVATTLWETSKIPRPMLSVSVELEKIDLEIEKSQYEGIICFVDDFLASMPDSKSDSTPAIEDKKEEKEEEPKEEEKEAKKEEEEKEEKPKEPGMPHYVYGVLSFACHAANYLLTSYLPFVCLMVFLCTTPVMIFRHFFQWLLILAVLAAFVAVAFLRTKKRVEAYNTRVDREAHLREKLVSASVLMKAFELRLNNDMMGEDEETEHIMALCVNDLNVNADVASNEITAAVVLRDVHIVDGVSSKLQGRDRQLLCVCDVDEQGCPSNLITKPLLAVNVTMAMASSPTYAESKQDILVGIDLGQANLVVSRVLIRSLLRFIAPSEKMKSLMHRAAVKADEKAQELKDKSDTLVEAPPKPIPADWERKSIVLRMNMDGASVMLDSETEGLVLKAGIRDFSVGVTICPAQLHVICELYDVYVRDCTQGCGLYPDFVAIAHEEGGKTGSDSFLNASIDLNNDDRWPNYPGYAIAASCSIGNPVLTVRMRLINELMNYFMSGPIMDGLALLSNPEAQSAQPAQPVQVEEKEKEPEQDLNIGQNLKDYAINVGKQYIVSNDEMAQEETHILQSLQGIAHNIKRHFIVPNPNDDNVPTEIPKLSVTIGKTTIHIPRASDSEDKVTMEVGGIEIGNTAPETKVRGDGLEVVKKSVVYTLNKINLSIRDVSLSTLIAGRCQTIMGKIYLTIDVVVAVKVEVALVLSRIVLAVSDDQVFTIIHLVNQNLQEQAVAIKALPATKPAKVVEEVSSEIPEDIQEDESGLDEDLPIEGPPDAAFQDDSDSDSFETDRSGVMPRSDSLTSLNSSMEVNDFSSPTEMPPKENNSAIADRIHANIMLEGMTIELFRGNGGYDGVWTSKDMYNAMGTKEGSLTAISIEDIGVKAYMHNMNISAAVSIASFFVKDSRPESPMLPQFRKLVQLGDEAKPAFTLLVGLENTDLGALHVSPPPGHTVDEAIMDIGVSIFLGQLAVLPSPFIFTLLNWVTAIGVKVGEMMAAKPAEPVEPVEPEELAIDEIPAIPAIPDVKEEEEKEEVKMVVKETKPAALIPNVVFKMHMDRMALYLVENTTQDTTPVFLFCFGVEVRADVSPCLDIKAGVSVNAVRASRSDVNLSLLPVDMRDAIYPFNLEVSASVADNIKNIKADVKASELVIRFGILDAKLIINAVTHILSASAPAESAESAEPAKPAKPVEKKQDKKKSTEEKKPAEVKEEKKEEDVMHILATVLFEKISFILVNDAKSFELPVLQFCIDQVKVDAAMGSNLFAHVAVVLSSEYYNASHTLWEPFLENCSLKVAVKQVKDVEERDPFVSGIVPKTEVVTQTTAKSQYKDVSDTMYITVDTGRNMNLNVTATLLNALIDLLNDFQNCASGGRPATEFYVYMNNDTELPMKYLVESDGDLGHLLESIEIRKEEEKRKDVIVYADVVDVVSTYYTHSRWMEFHSEAPHIRMFRHIPMLTNDSQASEENMVVTANDVNIQNATCGHIFPIAFSITEHGHTLYVEQLNDERNDKLVDRVTTLKEELSIPRVIQEPSLASFKKTWRAIPKGGEEAKMLPAHPSLALLFMKEDFRKNNHREVCLEVEGCRAVHCKVDREGIYYSPLFDKDVPEDTLKNGDVDDKKPFIRHHALLNNVAHNGRKVIEFTSNVAVSNRMGKPISLTFSNTADASQNHDFTLKDRCYECCPLGYVNTATIHVCVDNLEGSSFSVKDLMEDKLPRYVNLGNNNQAKALYARVTVNKEKVKDVYNVMSIDKYTVVLSPVMSVMNLLPMPLTYEINKMSSTLDTRTLEEGTETKINCVMLSEKTSESQVEFRVCPEGYDNFSTVLALSLETNKKESGLWIEDNTGRKIRLSYEIGVDVFNTISIQIYCDFWLVNCTGEELIVKDVAKNMPEITLPAVDTSIVMSKDYQFDSTKNMKPILFSYEDATNKSRALLVRTPTTDFCEGVTIDAIGNNTRTCPPKDAKDKSLKEKSFGVKVSTAPSMFTLTKIAVITPGMFLINRTGKDLSIRMSEEEDAPVVTLAEGAIVPFHCPAPVKELVVQVKCDSLHSLWTPFMQLSDEESQMMLEFDEDAEQSEQFLLRMRTGMNACQREVVFDFADSFNVFLYNTLQNYDPSVNGELSYVELLKASEGDDQKEAMERMTSIMSSKRSITEGEEKEEEEEEEEKEEKTKTLDVKVNFAGCGISMVDNVPQEFMYICVKDLGVDMVMANTGEIFVDMSLEKFQIDTGLSNPSSKFNVMLGSMSLEEEEEESAVDENGEKVSTPFFSLQLVMPSHPSATILEHMVMNMQPIFCNVNSTFLNNLLGLVDQMTSQLQVTNSSGRAVLEACDSFAPVNRIAANVGRMYLAADLFLLNAINIKFSFFDDPLAPLTKVVKSTSSPSLMPIMAVVNTVIGLVSSLDNATIDLNEFKLENHYSDMNIFVKKIVNFYVSEVLKKFYMLVGSFNLIGNPAELVGNITGGVKAFFSESAKGIQNGPVGIVGGVAKGATKMVGQTAFGVLNSATKITNTVGSSVASFAMDEQFQANRAAGKSNVLNNMVYGVTGIGSKTLQGFREGTKEGGVTGFAKGVVGGVTGLVKGTVGAVAMTATGALDTVTNVVNTAKNVAHKERKLLPVRDPRYIPMDGRLDPYNRYLASGGVLLRKANSNTGFTLAIGERYILHTFVNDGTQALVLTTNQVLLVTPSAALSGVAPYKVFEVDGSVTINENVMKLVPNNEAHSDFRDNIGRVKDNLGKHLIGDVKLRQTELTFESALIAEIMGQLLTQKKCMDNDAIADLVRRAIPEIHAGASLEEEEEGEGEGEGENDQDASGPRAPPSLKELKIAKIEFKSSEREVIDGGSKKVTKYKVELSSKDMIPAVWTVYFRYNDLDTLFKQLKAKCNKEDVKNLHLTSQRLKFLRTKNQRKEAVIRFLSVLSGSANLMKEEIVGEFFKKGAKDLHWKDEQVEDPLSLPTEAIPEVVEEIDSE